MEEIKETPTMQPAGNAQVQREEFDSPKIEHAEQQNDLEIADTREEIGHSKEKAVADNLLKDAKENGFDEALNNLAEGKYLDNKDEKGGTEKQQKGEKGKIDGRQDPLNDLQYGELEQMLFEMEKDGLEVTPQNLKLRLLEKAKQKPIAEKEKDKVFQGESKENTNNQSEKQSMQEIKDEALILLVKTLLEEIERKKKEEENEKIKDLLDALAKAVGMLLVALIGSEEDKKEVQKSQFKKFGSSSKKTISPKLDLLKRKGDLGETKLPEGLKGEFILNNLQKAA